MRERERQRQRETERDRERARADEYQRAERGTRGLGAFPPRFAASAPCLVLSVISHSAGPGRGHRSHHDGPAQLSPHRGAEAEHAVRGAGPGPHGGRLRTLQQPRRFQHQPKQYVFQNVRRYVCSISQTEHMHCMYTRLFIPTFMIYSSTLECSVLDKSCTIILRSDTVGC